MSETFQTVPITIVGPYVQAQHVDTEFYDTHFQERAYLETRRQHMALWHKDS